MSTRVDTKGREYHRPGAGRLMPFHKPIPGLDGRCEADIGEGETCRAVCYFVVTERHPEAGYDDGYWRHQQGTFWVRS